MFRHYSHRIGYNFPDHEAIKPFLEPTASGPSTAWAIATARRLGCLVAVGYPERALKPESLPTNVSSPDVFAAIITAASAHATADPGAQGKVVTDPATLDSSSTPTLPSCLPNPAIAGQNYNSAVTVAPNGQIVAHYRKSHLYYTDATWASEGSGFFAGTLPLPQSVSKQSPAQADGSDEVSVTMGICMDLNPYNFVFSSDEKSLAAHIMLHKPVLNILSMAWLSHDLTATDPLSPEAKEFHWDTLSYWVNRLIPVMEAGGETILVMANRCGMEPGTGAAVMGGDVCYAGTSTVMRAGRSEVEVLGVLGTGEERCLVVDTDEVSETGMMCGWAC